MGPKLVLYSGGQTPLNRRLHAELARLTGKSKGISMTYIPFCFDEANYYYKRAVRRYRPFGFSKFFCLNVDQNPSRADLSRAFQSDVIYLAGGNTFYLLHHLKKSGAFTRLKNFARKGGVLGGLSAGALIMTPNIRLAGHPWFDADENDVGLKDLTGLGLTQFEFFPHFDRSTRIRRVLEKYTKTCKHPVFAVPDGSGVIVEGPRTQVVGRVSVFIRGARQILP